MFPHPTDINWMNIRNYTSTHSFKRFILFLCSALVLIFLTTPTALVQVVSKNSLAKGALDLHWADRIPGFVGIFVKSMVPPLIVISINQLLLLLISFLGSFLIIQLSGRTVTGTQSTRSAS